jgi:hypothetical protein
MYYLVNHPYGLGALNRDGNRPCELQGFKDKAERDRQVAEWPGYNTIPDRNLVARVKRGRPVCDESRLHQCANGEIKPIYIWRYLER